MLSRCKFDYTRAMSAYFFLEITILDAGAKPESLSQFNVVLIEGFIPFIKLYI